MNRRAFLHHTVRGAGALAAAGGLSGCLTPGPNGTTGAAAPGDDVAQLSVWELQQALADGRLTSASLTQVYLQRIAALDRSGPRLRAVIELDPDATVTAARLDAERQAGAVRGPLHGLPVLLKDNLDTHDRMSTSAGSLALADSRPLRDALVVARLRAAGAVILGKTNLSEWANFRGARSLSGWSARGGQTKNPHVLDRNPSGSSSGSAVAVAAGLCAAAVGTETNGSIVSPAAYCGIVGLKPTVGLVSRTGIIPIAASMDTAGPMGRTVADVAALLNGLAGEDPRDEATQVAGRLSQDYTAALDPGALRGARLGLARAGFQLHPRIDPILRTALEALQRAGAVLVELPELPSPRALDGASYQVMLYEFKAGLNAYLAALGPAAPVKSLAEVIAFNERHAERELRFFGQEILLEAERKGPLTERAYLDARERCRRWSRTEGIDALLETHRLDALIAPTGGPALPIDWLTGDRGFGGSSTLPAVAGYPNLTVPCGNVDGLPLGLSFFGRAWSEPRLLGLGHAFETVTRARLVPRFLPTLELA